MKKLLIAIPAYGQGEYLNETLKSLAENNAESVNGLLETHVLVLDDGTPGGLEFKLPENNEHWHHAGSRSELNQGVTRTWNLALEMAMRSLDVDYVMIANSDLHFGPNVLKACVDALDSGYYAVFPESYKRRDKDGNVLTPHRYGGPLAKDFDARALAAAETSSENTCVTGGFAGWCFMLSKECLDKIGWFDPRFVLWYQDTDYHQRLAAAGHPAAEVRNCLIHHYESRTIVNLPGGFNYQGWITKDKELFARKYAE